MYVCNIYTITIFITHLFFIHISYYYKWIDKAPNKKLTFYALDPILSYLSKHITPASSPLYCWFFPYPLEPSYHIQICYFLYHLKKIPLFISLFIFLISIYHFIENTCTLWTIWCNLAIKKPLQSLESEDLTRIKILISLLISCELR